MICNNCKQEIGSEAVCPYCQARQFKNPQPHHLPVGTMIGGKYRIEGVLGEGGFGITYLSYYEKLDMSVAVKEYFPRGFSYRNSADGSKVFSGSDDNSSFYDKGKQRFLSEAKTLVRFSEEPGVVSVLDFIEENNTAYLVMEYLNGVTLQQYLKQNGTMSAKEAFDLLEPVIKTLAEIHAAGIIHRDISPDNIMHLHDGQLKLMDFGAARDFDGDNHSMSVMLKQGYAPEEQYRRNGDQGPWTDVYALCATIYRCITGKTPVDSLERLAEDTLQKPSSLSANISPALESVLLYGMAVRKKDRCQSMTELLSQLERAKQDINGMPVQNPNVTMIANADYGQNVTELSGTPQPDYTVVADQSVPVQNKPKKKKTALIILIIVLVCVAAAAVTGYFVITSFLSGGSDNKALSNYVPGEPEYITWSNEVDNMTYYYEFQPDGTFKGYIGTMEVTGTYTKEDKEEGKTLTLSMAFGSFIQNQSATYSISGSVKSEDLEMTCSYSDDETFTLKQSKREEIHLDPPENFTPDDKLTGSWLFTYLDYEIYRVVFNDDGSMIMEFIQDGVTYNGIYTIEDSTINFTYYTNEEVVFPLDYSVNGDNLTFMGYDFVRENSDK